MKLSDYVWQFIKKQVADSVFLVSGGHIMHLVDSLGKSGLNVYCCHHEQGVVTAAEGYARINNKIGVACVTLPGAPNAVTGVVGAWLDSIPVLVISGQVRKDHMVPRKAGTPIIRQIGFQEVDAVNLAKPITKYVVSVEAKEDIRYYLEKAVYLATHGRPGPVWIEIPLDIQEAEIESEGLRSFDPAELEEKKSVLEPALMEKIAQLLKEAKKPLFLAGNGIRMAGGEEILMKVLEKLKINVVTPIFTADDLVTYDYPFYLGRQGMPGNKTANYAIDNCDVLLVVGERLQLTQTSWDYDKFAAQATKIMVDVDEGELYKKTLKIDVPVHCDAKLFLENLDKQEIQLNRWEIKVEPINPDNYADDKKYLNVYSFLNELSDHSKGIDVATANGTASVSSHQALRISSGQRFITNAGLGNMGSGLPMAIGACIARGKKPIICLEGDGSIMMNLQELQTVIHHNLPLKIFIFNNNGYYSIRDTHLRYFKKIFAADSSSGVTLPDFGKLIPAWGLAYERINNNNELSKLEKIMDYKGPIVCELMLDPDQPMLERWSAGQLTDIK